MNKWKIACEIFCLLIFLTSCVNELEYIPNQQQGSDKYNSLVFNGVNARKVIPYGSAKTQGGNDAELTFDVFRPAGDFSEDRPMIILAPGGQFEQTENEEIEDLAEIFALSGYVVVVPTYRVVDVPFSDQVLKRALIDASLDLKAVVRFFRKDIEAANTNGVDPSQIFLGGYSSGAMAALHAAYVNTEEEWIDFGGQELLAHLPKQGGIEGNSGNEGFSSQVQKGLDQKLKVIEGAGHDPLNNCADCADEIRSFVFTQLQM